MAFSRLLAIPAAAVVMLAVVGAWIDGSNSTATITGASVPATASPTDGTTGAVGAPASTDVTPTTSSVPATAASAATAPGTMAPATPTTAAPATAAPATGSPATTTSCQSVVHIGDSTSVGLIDPNYLADPAQRVDAQYRRVGVLDPRMEISGARSIVETMSDQVNARDAAAAIKATGYEGCWVLALGTTDTANVVVGGAPGRAGRIDRMLQAIGDDPIMWVTVKTLVGEGDPWSNANMQEWNRELAAAATRYPNLRVYDWAAVVPDAWFQRDGIHYTSAGYAERARLLADALAATWPAP